MNEFPTSWSPALYNIIPVVLPHIFNLFFDTKIALLNQFLFLWNDQFVFGYILTYILGLKIYM